MDCQKVREIYERSCNFEERKELNPNYWISVIHYYSNDIKVKADANCIKCIELLKTLECNKDNELLH